MPGPNPRPTSTVGLLVVGHLRRLPQTQTHRSRPLHHSLGSWHIERSAPPLSSVRSLWAKGRHLAPSGMRWGIDWHSAVSCFQDLTLNWPTHDDVFDRRTLES